MLGSIVFKLKFIIVFATNHTNSHECHNLIREDSCDSWLILSIQFADIFEP